MFYNLWDKFVLLCSCVGFLYVTFVLSLQWTLVISESKGRSEILRDIYLDISDLQIEEKKINQTTTFHK